MFSISFCACFVWAVLLLVLPLNWIGAAVGAALVHECAHAAAILLLGGKIRGVRITVNGAVMDVSPMGEMEELLCTAAGLLGSILLMLTCRVFPRLAICAGVQALYNLLPIYPLDGGRLLGCICRLLAPQKADAILRLVENAAILLLTLVLAGLSLYHLDPWLLIFLGLLLGKVVLRKRPCKPGQIRVQ